MYNRTSALNLSLQVVLLLYILSLRKAEKDLSKEQDVIGIVPNILKAVLMIGKHRKLIDFNFCTNTIREAGFALTPMFFPKV